MKRLPYTLYMSIFMLLLFSACDNFTEDGSVFEEIVLMADEETYVSQRLPLENFDGPYVMQVFNYGSRDRMHAYVHFDLSSIPADATVVEARAELYYLGCEGIDDIAAYPARGTWNASTLTWNNQPGPYSTDLLDVVNLNPGSSAPADCGKTGEYVATPGGTASKAGWYIDDLAQTWLQNSSMNYGLVFLAPKQGVQAMFGVSEGTAPLSNPPRLVLKYER